MFFENLKNNIKNFFKGIIPWFKNHYIGFSWLLFPIAIIMLFVKKTLKYREKAQLFSSILLASAIIVISGLFKLLDTFVLQGLGIVSIFILVPLGLVWIIATVKAFKYDYMRCPILYNLACKCIKTPTKEQEDIDFDTKDLNLSEGTKSIVSSIISILIGILCGLIIMILISFISKDIEFSKVFLALKKLLSGPLAAKLQKNKLTNFGNMIFYSVPLIFTGLSVAIAYKTGLFNIGAPGQYVMGTMGCLLVALSIQSTTRLAGILVWILAIIVGTIFGMIWGMIPGLLKAFFNTNEVIICIMTNWIAANICTWVFTGCTDLISKENTKSAYLIKTAVTGNYTPTFGLDKLFPKSYIDCGIIIAIIVALIVLILLNKTTFGYELKACGGNKNAAKYAGLNEKKNIVLSMAIAGGLAAMGACFYFLNPGIEFKFTAQYSSLPAYGFNGIASAFLANCNPAGTIFSSIFIRYLNAGGEFINNYGFNRYVADIIVAIIIYVAGFSRIIRDLLSKKKKRDNSAREGGVKVNKSEEPKVEENKIEVNETGDSNEEPTIGEPIFETAPVEEGGSK